MVESDVIDTLVGIEPGSPLDGIRARRSEARIQAQTSYRVLFAPDDLDDVSAEERFAVAVFVIALHGATNVVAFYKTQLDAAGASSALQLAVDAAAAEAKATGPYGSYPPGPLSREDAPGPLYCVGPSFREALGRRLAAAFEHMHMLVYHPRNAAPHHLQALLDAGWSTTAIVTLSQIASFLAFQVRVVTGLRVLAGRT